MDRSRKALLATALLATLAADSAAQASTAVADVNKAALNAIRASAATTPPPRASRALAMISISVFDAVNASTNNPKYVAYQAGVASGAGLNKDAVAYAAGYEQMANLFPTLAVSLNAELDTKLGGLGLNATARAKLGPLEGIAQVDEIDAGA
jgi:hypothetical protein